MNAHTSQAGLPGTAVAYTSSRALASLLLAAGVAALVVLADHWMDDWAQTHALAATLALWGVAVAAIVALRGLTRWLARQAMQGLDAWSRRVAQRRADRRLWAVAQSDPQLMADLQSALGRSSEGPSPDILTLTQRRTERIVRDRLYYL